MKKATFIFSFAILAASAAAQAASELETCVQPRIEERSKDGISLHQGDKVILRVRACGEGKLNYEWAFVKGTRFKAAYQALPCKTERCEIDTGILKAGSHSLNVTVRNNKGAAFSSFSFQVLERPSKSMTPRTIEADTEAAADATQLNLSDIPAQIHDNSAYSRGIHHFSKGETIAARTELYYSLWDEPKYHEKAQSALNEIARQERWKAALHFGLLQDSNFLKQGSSSEAAGTDAPPKSRLAYRLDPSFLLRAYSAEQQETTIRLGLEREANFKFFNLFGLNTGASGTLDNYDRTQTQVAARHAYYNNVDWDKASLRLAAEARTEETRAGKSVIDSAMGLQMEVGSPSVRGAPGLALLLEKHGDPNGSEIAAFEAVTGEVAPWADHSSLLQQVALDYTVWKKATSVVRTVWQQETLRHDDSAAKAGDYNALRFQAKGHFRIGLKQAVQTEILYEGRLHGEAADARLDRKFQIHAAWSWYTYPYLYRSISVTTENNQSNRTSASYTRMILMISGSIEI